VDPYFALKTVFFHSRRLCCEKRCSKQVRL
jgi:hypothetical protein